MIDDKNAEEKVESQMIPPEVVMATTPFVMFLLTSFFRGVISFVTFRWLQKLFPQKKAEEDDKSSS